MGAQHAPHWLLPAYVRSVTALGATAPREQIEAAGRRLLERWCSPDRHHHDVTHLVAVLQRVDALAQETHSPEIVRVAAWYHGAVFDTLRLSGYERAAGENKPASAELAVSELTALGVPDRVAARVRDIILSLVRHDADPTDVDCMALCDADLGILAAEPQKYKDYRTRVREEFAHIDPRAYIEARIAIITRLLARRKLFLSPLASAWEEPARQNLAAELQKLKAELAKLPPRSPDEVVEMPPVVPPAPKRPPTGSRFARDDTLAESQVLPRIAPGDREGQGTATSAPAVRSASPDEDEPEVIGVPYEKRAARARRAELEVTSGIERVPQGIRDLPKKTAPPAPSAVSPATTTPAAVSPAATAPGSAPSPASAPTPAEDESAGEQRTETTTRRTAPDDVESTGTLFRPIRP